MFLCVLGLPLNKLLVFLKNNNNRGNRFMPTALKIFNSKVILQLLHGSPLCMRAKDQFMKWIQSMFLWNILGLLNYIPYAILCLETGQSLVETGAWLRSIRYWLKIHYNFEQGSFPHQLLLEPEWISPYWKESHPYGVIIRNFRIALPSRSILKN